MGRKLERLEEKVNRLTNIAWVLGTLAVVFGFAGGFGINAILEANSRITELNKVISDSEKLFIKHRKEQEAKFDQYVDSTKNEIVFVKILDNKISRINTRISGISLTASSAPTKSFGCSESGSYTADDLIVMYGSRDGTGCKVINENYFKTLSLNIPN